MQYVVARQSPQPGQASFEERVVEGAGDHRQRHAKVALHQSHQLPVAEMPREEEHPPAALVSGADVLEARVMDDPSDVPGRVAAEQEPFHERPAELPACRAHDAAAAGGIDLFSQGALHILRGDPPAP